MPSAELTKEEIKALTKDDFDDNPKVDSVKRFLLMTQKGPEKSVLDARPLWDNYWRLNFWLHQYSQSVVMHSQIVESRFVRVDSKGKKHIVKDLTKKGK